MQVDQHAEYKSKWMATQKQLTEQVRDLTRQAKEATEKAESADAQVGTCPTLLVTRMTPVTSSRVHPQRLCLSFVRTVPFSSALCLLFAIQC